MTIKNAVVAGVEFAHPFYDSLLAFMKEEDTTSRAMNAGELSHNGIETTEKMAELIGTSTFLKVDSLVVEGFALALMPEKYNDNSILVEARKKLDEADEEEGFMAAMAAMMGEKMPRGRGAYEAPQEIKKDLAPLEFTIVDIASFPQDDIYFKIVRNDKPEITAWIETRCLRKSGCNGDCEHCQIEE